MQGDLQEVLAKLNALDLEPIFREEKVTTVLGNNWAVKLGGFSKLDLDLMGVPLDRAERFLQDIKKMSQDAKARKRLKQTLAEVNCSEFYDVLLNAGTTAEDVLTLSHDDVKVLDISYWEKKALLAKIGDANVALKGNFEKIKLQCT